MECLFEEEINLPNGGFRRATCISKAEILITKDPCYGLCYHCAYKKIKAELDKVKVAAEKVCKIYFEMLEEFISEEEIRRRRDDILRIPKPKETNTILDVNMLCPYCGKTAPVKDCEPDIDGDGNLGCPECLAIRDKKVVMKQTDKLKESEE